ncbi:hypothetical protein CRG98_004021 [Punica granatum]|uniref:Uncharacterized protein n=1 Tax=Punica granatum TaxID=22663 RepID=A0A2I0L4R5_PUNGR|nr:hypothetical protein CRG98_004021 [Punica granatum]
MADISILLRLSAISGELTFIEVTALTEGFNSDTWRGTNFPLEKSSSAGSIATGSSRQNSKSPPNSSGSGSGSWCPSPAAEEATGVTSGMQW